MTHPDFQLLDPMRRPDWRFQRALTLFEAGQTPRRPGRWDDRQVRFVFTPIMSVRGDGWSRPPSWRARTMRTSPIG